MIKSFKCKKTEKLFHRNTLQNLPQDLQKIGHRKLLIIDAATNINDLKIPPGNELEKLKGNKKGLYSIRINKQWRICFEWKNNDAYNIEIIDYHK